MFYGFERNYLKLNLPGLLYVTRGDEVIDSEDHFVSANHSGISFCRHSWSGYIS